MAGDARPNGGSVEHKRKTKEERDRTVTMEYGGHFFLSTTRVVPDWLLRFLYDGAFIQGATKVTEGNDLISLLMFSDRWEK